MNSSIHNMERFDAYLNFEMSETDRVQFETELKENPALKAEFNFHRLFMDDLVEGAEYHSIRNILRTIHKKPGVGDRNFFLSKQFYIPLSMVAVVTLIITIMNPFVKNGNEGVAAADTHSTDDKVESMESSPTEAMDSTSSGSVDIGMDLGMMEDLSSEFLPPAESDPSATAFQVSENGYFMTSNAVPGDKKIIILQSVDKKRTFEALVVYRDPDQRFSLLKCHPKVIQHSDSVPIRLFDGDIDTVKRVFTIGFEDGIVGYFHVEFKTGSVYTPTQSDSLAYLMKIKTRSTMSGSPVFTEDGELIGIVVLLESSGKSVTYVLDAHYIGIKLDYLIQQDTDLNMDQNYYQPDTTQSAYMKTFKPFIFELHW